MARSVGNNGAFAREESARSARNYRAIARKESIGSARSNGAIARKESTDFNYLRSHIRDLIGKLQMKLCKKHCDEMFVEVFGPEHHGCVRGYGDDVSPIELRGSSSSTICDLQMQLKESKERCKENDANLLR
nr:hypothetical protein CFP56_18762 [Quercus suber]